MQLGDSLIPGSTPGASLILQSETLIQEGRFAEAVELLRGCLAVRQKALPEGHRLIADTLTQLGAALAGAGEFVEAEERLLDGYTKMKDDRSVPVDRRERALERIIRLYESWDKPDQASRWRRRLESTAANSDHVTPIPDIP